MSVPDTIRHGARKVIFEEYPEMGFNYRMTDIQAAVGREQLKRLPAILARRAYLAAGYCRALRGIRGLEAPCVPNWARTNFQSYPVRVTPEYPLRRDELMQVLLHEEISTRRGIMNAHQEVAYRDTHSASLPCSEAARDTVILLPLSNDMTTDEQARVIGCLRRIGDTAKAG
jgi:dTDP-4-amino-4,6-dideoxygalactose transaminase